MIRFLFSCLFVLLLNRLPAQTPAYIHYAVVDGLPSNLIYGGTQDHQGLLWFATDKGLASFDGSRFRTFGMKDGLPDPEVLNVWVDSQKRLWICCFQTIPCIRQNARINLVKDSAFQIKPGLAPLYNFYEDAEKRIWIASNLRGSEMCINPGQEAIRINSPMEAMYFADLNGTTIGLGNKEIIRRVHGTDFERIFRFSPRYFNVENNRIDGVGVMGERVLFAYRGWVYLFEWTGETFELIDKKEISSGKVYTDRQGRFWVCSLTDGAICFDNLHQNLSNPKHYLPGKKVTNMFEDNQGTKWFCTLDDGIYGLPRAAAVTYSTSDGLYSDNITALQTGPTGLLLLGDDNANLYTFDGKSFERTDLDRADAYNKCRQIIVDKNGSIIIATDKEVFSKSSGGELKKMHHTLGAPKSVLSLGDTLWIGSHGNIGFLSGFPQQTETRVKRQRVTRITEDPDGVLWFGSINGLYSWKDRFSLNWDTRFPALKGRIVDIQKANGHGLWIVTPEKGLMLAKTQNGAITDLQIINDRLKTPLENIQCVFTAPDGLLWIGTNHGVYCLYPDWTVIHYDRHDGLANDDINTLLVKGDTLWVASVSGLTRLLLKPSKNNNEFPTYITRVSFLEKEELRICNLLDSVSGLKELRIVPGASVIKINVTGIDFRSRGNLRYRCIISKGLLPWYQWTTDNLLGWIANGFQWKSDTTWLSGSELNLGVFLPAATYELEVTAVTNAGVFSPMPDTWTLIKAPYWYGTVWISLLIWTTIITAFAWFWRTRSVNRHLHTKVSELQLQALQAQMNPHFIGNSINTIQQFFYSPDPVRASEYTSVFIRLLRSTMMFSEWHFIPFSDELAYLKDYLRMMELRYGDHFRFEIIGLEHLPPDTPFPTMLLQPIVENAVIHGMAAEQDSLLIITFNTFESQVICIVEDNGIGYNKMLGRKKHAGNERKSKGLELLRKKMFALNSIYKLHAYIKIEDLAADGAAAHGTRVTLQFSSLKSVKSKLKKLYTGQAAI